MRKIRIKKDLSCVWRILTNGAPSALAGRDLTLYLVTPFARLRLAFATEGNACKFEVGHEVQGFTGIYGLELWENEGKQQQTIADLPEAFELVDLTTEEDDGTASDLKIAFLDLGTSSLAVGVGAEIIEDLRKQLPKKQDAKMDKVYTSFVTRDGFKGVNIYLLKGQVFDFNIEGSTKAKMIYPNGSGMEAPFPKVEDAHGNADGWHFIGGTSGTTKITISVKVEDEIRCHDARISEEGKPFVIDTSASSMDISVEHENGATISSATYKKAVDCAKNGLPLIIKCKLYLRGGYYIASFPVSACTFSSDSLSNVEIAAFVRVASSMFHVTGGIVDGRLYMTFKPFT